MKKIYITTPAYYPNDVPHIGHAYTTILADVLARWYRLKFNDKNTILISGLDEHGEKIESTAKEKSLNPQKFVDMMADKFKETWAELNINFSGFIRTSNKKHIEVVKKIFKKIYDSGDIYKGFYEDWYCVPCETYWTETQLENGKCQECKRDVKKLKEESYFFKLSKYQNKLLELYKTKPNFISPEYRKQEIINRVKEGLKDLSISRKNVKWGVPLPIDKSFTLYCWIDALSFYLSVIDYPKKNFKKLWPPDLQLMAKDILWFHAVIQPALLMSAKISLPKKLFAHGWLMVNGEKMSKSKGNFVNPISIVNKYGNDALRYYLIREIPFGQDGDFSENLLIARLNNELANDLGNLVSRALTLVEKFFNNKIKKGKIDPKLKLNFKKIDSLMEEINPTDALSEIWKFVKEINKYVNDKKPWENEKERKDVLYTVLDSIRIIALLLYPFIPETSEKINKQLNIKLTNFKDVKFGLLKEGIIKKGEILFKKIEGVVEKQTETIKNTQTKSKPMVKYEDFQKLEIKVGKIKSAKEHPNADKLLILEVDTGDKVRQIVAGLKGHYKPEELKGKEVIVLTNLEPRDLRGFKSDGMLLAAIDGSKVVALTVDKDVKTGSEIR